MDECKYCIYFNAGYTYNGTGFCEICDDFVKDDNTCEYYEEEE